ncbi:MAG: hypothetical protein U9N77_11860 [Thermodesulfobacteriota bacterium]|nr:hypothetical protein [Thermodesulfobacteriota bacterium]
MKWPNNFVFALGELGSGCIIKAQAKKALKDAAAVNATLEIQSIDTLH